MRRGLWLLLALLSGTGNAATPDSAWVDARIAASARAAQGLQGPLDGGWILSDAGGRQLYVFQIVDPVGQGEPLQAAWREPGGGLGYATLARGRRDRLGLTFDADQRRVRLILHRSGAVWRGEMRVAGPPIAVVLRRG